MSDLRFSVFDRHQLDHNWTAPESGDPERCKICGGFRAVHPEHAPESSFQIGAEEYRERKLKKNVDEFKSIDKVSTDEDDITRNS